MSTENIKDAIDAGKRIATLEALGVGTLNRVLVGGKPYIYVPAGLTLTDAEGFLPAPIRKRATVSLDDAASFINYVKRFTGPNSVVFGDLTNRKFEAVLDYHAPADDGASWCTHRALLTCDPTSAWETWSGQDKKQKNQVDFARFIEENIPNIMQPDGALLLEICTNLEAKSDVNFRSSTRLANGQTQFKYEETIEGTAAVQAGQVSIPEVFKLALEPFQGVGMMDLEARLRYRIGQGALTLWYELVRPDDVLDAAFNQLVQLIQTGIGETPIYAGTAPGSVLKATAK